MILERPLSCVKTLEKSYQHIPEHDALDVSMIEFAPVAASHVTAKLVPLYPSLHFNSHDSSVTFPEHVPILAPAGRVGSGHVTAQVYLNGVK